MNSIKLRDDVDNALNHWDEVSLFNLAEVNNLTRADMDSLLGCCDWYDAFGDLSGLRYFSPGVKSVLRKYGAIV